MRSKVALIICAVAVLSSQALAHESPFKLVGSKTVKVTDNSLKKAEKSSSKAAIGKDKKSISFVGKTVRLVVHTGPEEDMMSFRIRNLRNPSITVARGATLKVLFVNTDGDMLHNMRFTADKAPFDTKMGNDGSSGSTSLKPKSGKTYSGQEMVVKVPSKPGTYTYVCTVAGHAAAGMYGRIIVR